MASSSKRARNRASLEDDLSTRHLFVLAHLETHIQTLENQLAEIDYCLLKAMQP